MANRTMTTDDTTRQIRDALASYHNTHHGANRYNTPWRPGADGGTLAVDEDPAYGLGFKWFDHKDGTAGNGFTLARQMGIAVQGHTAVDDTPFVSMDDYAHAHGAPVEVFTAAGWSETQRAGHLVFAFQTRNGMRYRYADPATAKRKYDSDRGYSDCWYGLERAVALAAAGAPFVLCNGEASTVAAQYHGVAACCVTGGEKGTIPAALLDELRAVYSGPVRVAFDCDATGRKAGGALARFLAAAGFDTHAVDLGGTNGYDLADFCRLHNGTSVQALNSLDTLNAATGEIISASSRQSRPAHKTNYVVSDWQSSGITAADLFYKHFEPLIWTVENIIPESTCLLAGKPKSKKSWFALAIGCAVALGGKALGMLGVRAGRVLYLDLESNQRRAKARLFSIVGRAMEQMTNLHIYTKWARGEEAIQQLEGWMAAHPDTALIVIDVLADFRRGKDPKEDAYLYDRETVGPITEFADRHRISILMVHHTRKAKADDVFDEISGSTGLISAVGTALILGRAPNGSNEMVLDLRGRDLVNDEPLALAWDDYTCQHVITGGAADAKLGAERRSVLKVMADDGEWSPKDIAAELTKPVTNVQQMIKTLLSEGLIERTGRGKYVRVITRDQNDQNDQIHKNGQNDQIVDSDLHLQDQNQDQNRLDLYKALESHSDHSDRVLETNESDPFWATVPPNRLTFLRLYLRSNQEKDQLRAQELCDEYQLDYTEAKKRAAD